MRVLLILTAVCVVGFCAEFAHPGFVWFPVFAWSALVLIIAWAVADAKRNRKAAA